MIKIATPVSNLFQDSNYKKVLSEYSDCLELRDLNLNITYPKIEVYHSELQPIHELKEEDFDYLRKINNIHSNLKLVTFHCASSCSNPNIKNGMFEKGVLGYKRADLFENAKRNFKRIKGIFKDIKIAVENTNYYPTSAYKYITDADFISTLVYDNEIYFLFDIAHAKITAHNRKIDYLKYEKELPYNRVIQIHISHFATNGNGLAYDAHHRPKQEEFREVKNIVHTYDVMYLTIEYYKDIDNLLLSIEELRKIKNELYRKSL